MAKASQAQEPSMEEILASIRRIISDEVAPAPQTDNPVGPVGPVGPSRAGSAEAALAEHEGSAAHGALAVDNMATHVSEDDLDRLFSDGAKASSSDIFDEAFTAEEEEPIELDEEMEIAVEPATMPLVEGMPEETDLAFVEPPPPAPELKPAPPHAASIPFAPESPMMNAHSFAPPPAAVPQASVTGAPLMSQEAGSLVSGAFASLANSMMLGAGRTVEDLVQDMLRPLLKEWLDDNLPNMVERLVRAEIERVSRGNR